jgi:hypothetical protein
MERTILELLLLDHVYGKLTTMAGGGGADESSTKHPPLPHMGAALRIRISAGRQAKATAEMPRAMERAMV